MKHSLAPFLFLVCLVSETSARTWYVAPEGIGSGTSWETAFPTISEALVAASTGDEIWVAEGIHAETLTIEVPVTLLGGFEGNETERNERDWEDHLTEIRGDQTERLMATRVDTRISGFTMRDGRTFSDDASEELGKGGAIYQEKGKLRIDHCSFSGNSATSGGVIHSGGGVLEIESCSFIENTGSYSGAVLSTRSAEVTIKECEFIRNVATFTGVGSFSNSNVTVESSIFSFNVRTGHVYDNGWILTGPGVFFIVGETELLVSNSLFQNNESRLGGLSENFAFLSQSTPFPIIFRSCTFITLKRRDSCVWIRRGSDSFAFQNCIMANCDDPIVVASRSDISVTHSNISGGYLGPGNIDADPLFIDPTNGNFRLQPNSPCIDAGTVVETLTDLDGNPRPVDVVGRGAEGAGAFDMGAYEFQLRPADLTRDGWVDGKDLIEFQKEWMRGEE